MKKIKLIFNDRNEIILDGISSFFPLASVLLTVLNVLFLLCRPLQTGPVSLAWEDYVP